jgi:DNA-directed RNA polymerase beta' subunit
MLKIYGLTTGLHDFFFSREQMEKMNTIKNVKFRTLYSSVSKYDKLIPSIDLAVSNELSVIQNNNEVLGNIMEKEFHMFHDIVTCGAKGSLGDMNKMSYCVGQTFIGADRYSDRSPYIAKFDNSSRYGLGVVESGYMQGQDAERVCVFHRQDGSRVHRRRTWRDDDANAEFSDQGDLEKLARQSVG